MHASSSVNEENVNRPKIEQFDFDEIGKPRIASQLAFRAGDSKLAGVWLSNLVPIRDARHHIRNRRLASRKSVFLTDASDETKAHARNSCQI